MMESYLLLEDNEQSRPRRRTQSDLDDPIDSFEYSKCTTTFMASVCLRVANFGPSSI